MATGGDTADHLHCSVCLEHYKGRNPRLLSCHHSFCEGCLKKLVKYGQISCPKCREMTAVKDGDVKNLTMNFHILPQLEESQNFKKKCQLCNISVAILKCEECNQFLCQECSESHSKVKKFKHHIVLKLCVKHAESVSQLCIQCVKPVCFKCLILEHQEHEDMVLDYKEGMKQLRDRFKEVYSRFEENLNDINTIIKEDELKIREAEQMVRKYKSKREELKKQTLECELLIDTIQSKYSDKEKIQKEQKEKRAIAENSQKLVDELVASDNGDEHILSHFKELIEFANRSPKKCLSDVRRVPSLLETISHINQSKKLVINPERVATIKSNNNLKIEDVTSGTTAWDNSIIIADRDQYQVTQINKYGEIEEIYPIEEQDGELLDICVHGSSLYIGQEYGISTVVNIHEPNSFIRKYRLQQGLLGGICVVSHTKVLCTDFEDNKVFQYDPYEKSTTLVAMGLIEPTYINTMITDEGMQYIVTLHGEHCLKVYSSKWRYEYTIGKGGGSSDGYLLYPGGSVCTDEGILVADTGNNRVCLFNRRGEFIRHYLTEDDGIDSPNGIVYMPPYLWVVCSKVVLCYKVHS